MKAGGGLQVVCECGCNCGCGGGSAGIIALLAHTEKPSGSNPRPSRDKIELSS